MICNSIRRINCANVLLNRFDFDKLLKYYDWWLWLFEPPPVTEIGENPGVIVKRSRTEQIGFSAKAL